MKDQVTTTTTTTTHGKIRRQNSMRMSRRGFMSQRRTSGGRGKEASHNNNKGHGNNEPPSSPSSPSSQQQQLKPREINVESSEHQKKVHLPTPMRQAVVDSWKMVETDLEQLGMDFFLTLFREHPQMKDLFQFGGVETEDLRNNVMLKAHATGVMKTVGVALSALSDMEALIPVLRNLGRIHTLVGVRPHYYDMIYGILIQVIAKHVGPDKWSSETEEAWELCYTAITAVMKDPSRHLEVEPAEGWGLWNAVVCSYLAVVTPLQLADFGHVWIVEYCLLPILNLVAIVTFLLDLGSEYLQRTIELKSRERAKNLMNTKQRWFFLKFRAGRIIHRLGLSRWSPWPMLDMAMIGSFVITGTIGFYLPPGLAVTIGLVRVLALTRVVHFFRCAELVSLKSSDISTEDFHYGQLSHLFMILVYMIHLFGCLHCIVSKLSNRENSTFAPVLQGLLESPEENMINAYLHTTYWAFVNVAGIGNYDSVPETSLEIVFSMVVHLVGASLYASAAGSIFALLESRASAFTKVRDGVASLKDFMQDCNIPPTSQEAFVSAFLMRTYISSGEQRGAQEAAIRPLLPEAAESLPPHLTSELVVFSRAKAIRDRGIKTASAEFSFVLAESLVEKLTLLSGDYLFQQGEESIRRVYLVDKGKLEVFVDGVSKGCLYPGDIIGLGWLASRHDDSPETARQLAYMDWTTISGDATADVRAMDHVQLVAGLDHSSQTDHLNRLYGQDMERLKDSLLSDMSNSNGSSSGEMRR